MQGDNQANVIQKNTQSKSGDNFLTILLTILLLIAVSIAGFFAWQVQNLNKALLESRNQNLEKQTSTPEPESTFPMYTEPSSIPSDWKTYVDKITKFSFKYPSKYEVETIVRDSGTGFSYLLSPDNTVTITIFTKYTDGQVKYYMDSPSIGMVRIGENIWSEYFLPQGYPDGAVGAGKPIYGLQTEIQNHLFSVTLFNQKEVMDEQKQILSTFKFTD